MNIFRLGAVLLSAGAIVSVFALSGGSGDISTEGLSPEAEAFVSPIDSSHIGELTIMSFNIRDLQGRKRTLEDFQVLTDLMDEADIVVFQELGAKGLKNSGNEAIFERFEALKAVCKTYLGEEWAFVLAPEETPKGNTKGGPEVPFLAYRTQSNGMSISANWDSYYDLGERRDMGIFNISCALNGEVESFVIGSIHTKYNAPYRGQELIRVGNYIEENEDEKFILLGDLNWGYKSSGSDGYIGEEYITDLHEQGKVLQLFNAISFNGYGGENDFRTNLDVRKYAQMYDQFLICKTYANRLSEDGKLGKDCGFYSFSREPHFNKLAESEVTQQLKGVKAYLRSQGIKQSSAQGKQILKESEESIRAYWKTQDEVTFQLSDHKPIWMQLTLFP